VSPLVRTGQPHGDDLEDLRVRSAEAERRLSDRAAEIGRLRLEIDAFKIKYREQVGLLHEELDELELQIDEAERGVRASQAQGEAARPSASARGPRAEPLPRYTTDAVRSLFRDVAKAIHPDLAGDDHTRDRRHTLMIEANHAYALGDEERLRSILQSWERGPESVQGSDPASARLRLERRIAQIEEQLAACDGELGDLQDSPMWRLKAMVDEAAGKGKDLVGDMVRRLKRDILVARNRLDAIQSIR
jgi:hypothetical protein